MSFQCVKWLIRMHLWMFGSLANIFIYVLCYKSTCYSVYFTVGMIFQYLNLKFRVILECGMSFVRLLLITDWIVCNAFLSHIQVVKLLHFWQFRVKMNGVYKSSSILFTLASFCSRNMFFFCVSPLLLSSHFLCIRNDYLNVFSSLYTTLGKYFVK